MPELLEKSQVGFAAEALDRGDEVPDVSGILGYLDKLPERVLVIHYPSDDTYGYMPIGQTMQYALIAAINVPIIEILAESVKDRRGRGTGRKTTGGKYVWRTIDEAREIVRAKHREDRSKVAVAVFVSEKLSDMVMEYINQ